MTKGPAPVDFFDEDDEPAERPARRIERSVPPPVGSPRRGGGGGSRRGGGGSAGGGAHGPASRQQARSRQIAFLLGAIVMLILIVIAVRGCLDARKDRSFQNYVSDLSSITADRRPNQRPAVRDPRRRERPGLGGDRAAERSPERGRQLPGAVDRARDLERSRRDRRRASPDRARLRAQARRPVGDRRAAGQDRRRQTTARPRAAIYTQMKVLSASDILYARAKDQIEQVLADRKSRSTRACPTASSFRRTRTT